MDVPDLEEVWDWCRSLPTLEAFAIVDKGLEHRSDLSPDKRVFSENRFPDGVPGFVHLNRELALHELPKEYWVNINPAVVRRLGADTMVGVPQVLLNHTRVSRGPWRLKALVDEQGHTVTGRFLTVRPRRQEVPLFYLWALLNSPFANGFAYAHSTARHVLKKTIVALPVPRSSGLGMLRVAEAVQAYLHEVRDGENARFNPDRAKGLLLSLDAALLRLYALPPRVERKLLDLFRGYPRQGVPFSFNEYFPADFEPAIPLHFFLSEEYRRSTAGALRSRHRVASSPEILKALRRAVEDFSEERPIS